MQSKFQLKIFLVQSIKKTKHLKTDQILINRGQKFKYKLGKMKKSKNIQIFDNLNKLINVIYLFLIFLSIL